MGSQMRTSLLRRYRRDTDAVVADDCRQISPRGARRYLTMKNRLVPRRVGVKTALVVEGSLYL